MINDTIGHDEGDRAIRDAAKILKNTFRCSDIIARLGGDEFAILVTDVSERNAKIITNRLHENIDTHNKQANRKYEISMSFGIVHYDPEKVCSLEELLDLADKLMYEQKLSKHNKFSN